MKVDLRKLEIARGRKCWTVQDLMRESGIPAGTYSAIPSQKNVRIETIGRLAKALEVDIEYLILDETAEEK